MPISDTSFDERLRRIAGQDGFSRRRPARKMARLIGRVSRIALMVGVFGLGAKTGAMTMMGDHAYKNKTSEFVEAMPPTLAPVHILLKPDYLSSWGSQTLSSILAQR